MGRPRTKPLNPVVGRLLEFFQMDKLPPPYQLKALAEQLRVPEGTVRNWNKRESGVPMARLEAIAADVGVSVAWLLDQAREPYAPLSAGNLGHPLPLREHVEALRRSESPAPWLEGERSDSTQAGGAAVPTSGLANSASGLLARRGTGAVRPLLLSVPLGGGGGPSRDYELIPKHLRAASAGRPGALGAPTQGDEVDLVGDMAFSFEWLRHNMSHTTGSLTTIQVRGDSMATTLLDGDTIMIDEGVERIDVDGIYVLDIAGRRLVKRVQHLFDGTLVLISDNPSYQRETIPRDRARDVKVIGRMVWPRVR